MNARRFHLIAVFLGVLVVIAPGCRKQPTQLTFDPSAPDIGWANEYDTLQKAYSNDYVCLNVPVVGKDNEFPVISVMTFPGGVPYYYLHFVLWRNGKMVWSIAHPPYYPKVLGGAPFYETNISIFAVQKIMNRIDQYGVFKDRSYNSMEASLCLDLSYYTISIVNGTKAACLTIPAEFYAKTNMDISGMTPDDRRRYEVYMAFSKYIESIIPKGGRPISFKYTVKVLGYSYRDSKVHSVWTKRDFE